MKKWTQTQTQNSKMVTKILLINILYSCLILLSFKFVIVGMFFIIFLMPIFCKKYLEESLFVNIRPIDYFTSINFVVSCVPGGFILFVIEAFKILTRKNN